MQVLAAACARCTVLLVADLPPEPEQVADARAGAGPHLTRVLEATGVPRPRALLLHVFEEKRLLEVWAAAAAEGARGEPPDAEGQAWVRRDLSRRVKAIEGVWHLRSLSFSAAR